MLFFSIFIMQLTKQQRIFIVTVWMQSKSIKSFLKDFRKAFLKEMFQIVQQFGKMLKRIAKKVLRGYKVN